MLLPALLLAAPAAGAPPVHTLSGPATPAGTAFIYVYPLPSYYNLGGRAAAAAASAALCRRSVQEGQAARAGMDRYPWMVSDTTYDADREMFKFWGAQGFITGDPCKAQLFYVPVFSADYCQVAAAVCACL